MTTLLATEFPDFDVATLPTIPAGFIDSSWHNDASPSFTKGELQIFVADADPAMREHPESPRFALVQDCAETLVETDDWSELLAAIANAEA